MSQALPDWHVVMMPAVNYGHGGANLLGDRPIHPGTYAIRQSTLRSLVADIGARIAENGFKWIFVMNGHGAPTHNIALNEASDFVSETYAVTMLHVTALFQADAAIQSNGEKIKARIFRRRSFLLWHGRPCRRQRNMPDPRHPAGSGAARLQVAAQPVRTFSGRAARNRERTSVAGLLVVSCQGDGGARRAIEGWWIDGFTDLILRAVGGENMFVHPRLPDAVPAAVAPTIEKQLANEAAFDASRDWRRNARSVRRS